MTPGVRDVAALKDDVFDTAVRKDAARREAGLAGPNDDDGDAGGSRGRNRDQLTVTATLVGFVTMSNTAERFCDWATSASMSSGEASASMS